MTKPLLRGAADATWEQAMSIEGLAAPHCFTTRTFGRSVQEPRTQR